MGKKRGGHTVRRVLLHNLHDPHNSRYFTARMVEKRQIPLFHRAEVVPSYTPSVNLLLQNQVSKRKRACVPAYERMPVVVLELRFL